MQLSNPILESSSAPQVSTPTQLPESKPIDVTPEEVRTMILCLRQARLRAIDIRDRAPAGSYLENVLTRTIDGIALELSQLDYLLSGKSKKASAETPSERRMRPAI